MSGVDKLLKKFEGRSTLDISQLKTIVFDEADVFFETNKDDEKLGSLIGKLKKVNPNVQIVFISATYSDLVAERIEKIVPDAS